MTTQQKIEEAITHAQYLSSAERLCSYVPDGEERTSLRVKLQSAVVLELKKVADLLDDDAETETPSELVLK